MVTFDAKCESPVRNMKIKLKDKAFLLKYNFPINIYISHNFCE